MIESSIGPLIEELCDYAMSGRAGVLLQPIERDFDQQDLLLITSDIVCWLQSQARFRTRRPLTLNSKYPWCQSLIRLANGDNEIARWFAVKDDALDFVDSIADEEKERARRTALEKFKTRVIH